MTPEIWQQIREGDSNAMNSLYQTCYQELFAFGFKLLPDKDKVKDTLHELFCDIWQRRGEIGQVMHVKAYLKTCVRNKLLKEINQNLKIESLGDQELENITVASYEQLLIESEIDTAAKEKMWNALQQLTHTQKEVIKLKFYDDLSYEAIAILLKLKPRTVYNHVYSAICTLRSALSHHKR